MGAHSAGLRHVAQNQDQQIRTYKYVKPAVNPSDRDAFFHSRSVYSPWLNDGRRSMSLHDLHDRTTTPSGRSVRSSSTAGDSQRLKGAGIKLAVLAAGLPSFDFDRDNSA